jgi:mRNA interferase YafQ
MLKPTYTNQFKKDLKLIKKRKKDIYKLKSLIIKISKEESLDHKYKKHKLVGDYKNRWECHVEPDWLLIYFESKNEIIFERTGSHSDLFD